jgi:hypothetical protein
MSSTVTPWARAISQSESPRRTWYVTAEVPGDEDCSARSFDAIKDT